MVQQVEITVSSQNIYQQKFMSNESSQVNVTPYGLPCKSEYDTFLECHPNTYIEPRIILVTILAFKASASKYIYMIIFIKQIGPEYGISHTTLCCIIA